MTIPRRYAIDEKACLDAPKATQNLQWVTAVVISRKAVPHCIGQLTGRQPDLSLQEHKPVGNPLGLRGYRGQITKGNYMPVSLRGLVVD